MILTIRSAFRNISTTCVMVAFVSCLAQAGFEKSYNGKTESQVLKMGRKAWLSDDFFGSGELSDLRGRYHFYAEAMRNRNLRIIAKKPKPLDIAFGQIESTYVEASTSALNCWKVSTTPATRLEFPALEANSQDFIYSLLIGKGTSKKVADGTLDKVKAKWFKVRSVSIYEGDDGRLIPYAQGTLKSVDALIELSHQLPKAQDNIVRQEIVRFLSLRD